MLPVFEPHSDRGQPPKVSIPSPARDLTSNEAWQFWCDVFDDTQNTDPTPYRVILCWRLTRAMAVQGYLMAADQLLTRLERDDWSHLRPPTDPNETQEFIDRIDQIGQNLALTQPTRQLPDLPTGLSGLGHTHTISDLWPPTYLILEFERSLVNQIQTLALRWSRMQVIDWLADTLGLHATESGPLIKASLENIRSAYLEDPETQRFLMIQRIQDIIQRAKELGQLNIELKAIRELATVQGLIFRPKEDTNPMSDLLGIMSAVARQPDPPKALPDEPRRYLQVTVKEPEPIQVDRTDPR